MVTATKKKQPLKLTNDNYYSHDMDFQYLSKSVFAMFEDCEASAMAQLKDEWKPQPKQNGQPDPLIFGNFIHSYFQGEEAHKEFLKDKDVQKEVYKYGNPEKGFKKAYGRAGEATSMINKMKLNGRFNYYYKPQQPESKEIIVTGQIDGYWWKGKIDSLNLDKNYFCDLKTTKDIHAVNWIKDGDYNVKTNFVEAYGYYMQMAIYQELIKQTFGKECLPLMFVVSKQSVPEVANLVFDRRDPDINYLMNGAMDKVKELQPHIWRVMMGEEKPKECGKCEYCRYSINDPEFILPTQIEV